MTPSVRGFRVRLVTLPNTPLTLRGAGLIANELLPLTPAKRGEPGRVPDLSIRSLAYTGSSDSSSSYKPVGPMAFEVMWMGSFFMKLRHPFR